ncbi:MAG: DNA polymerase/3'-5' exonuclease PolX, partial [Candidatus Omnitrophica bacterium]|nr:DNA polymerase/3'-5' exonuclease PolX [Candidatus Omnitrophota bacterium]
MDNKEIAQVLEEIAELLEIKGDNPFKIRAYHNGARIVEGLSQDIRELVREDALAKGKIKGIGIGLAEKIAELVKTGKCKYHRTLRKSLPAGLLNILNIPGLGPKRAKALYEELDIKSVEELQTACRENRVSQLEGFGEKSQSRILEALEHRQKSQGYFLIAQAQDESKYFVAYLKKSRGIIRIEVAGSIRRSNEIVHDVDILVSTKTPAPIHRAFINYAQVDHVLAKGETKSSVVLKSGLQVDLRTVTDREFPYALYYFTGSKEHNVATRTIAKKKGLKISEYGIFKLRARHAAPLLVLCQDEADIFKVLGLRYIPPELRENTGEIEAARGGARHAAPLPDLIEEKDVKGIFHVHSTYSDGTASLEAMIRAAEGLGYEYVGISDHSQSATYANGLSVERLKKQYKELDQLERKYKRIRIFRGIESDILADGGLDYSDRVLGMFDFVIGSIHSRFQMSEKEMTQRICRAMEHPAMTIWGHPTGRLLLGRAGYAVDYDAIFETARKHGVVIELNANPQRLDLDWRISRGAKEKGLKFSINPDAHSVKGLSDTRYGVGIARKGWL